MNIRLVYQILQIQNLKYLGLKSFSRIIYNHGLKAVVIMETTQWALAQYFISVQSLNSFLNEMNKFSQVRISLPQASPV